VSKIFTNLGRLVRIRTGKLDANANDPEGEYPFFTCAKEPLRISTHSYDCECVLIAGNGDLNVKYYKGKFDAYQRTYIIESLNPDVLDVRYLYHFMDKYLAKLRQMSIGGVIKYIKIGNLTDAELPVPNLPEQRRIAAILDQADTLRTKRREALVQLDSLTQSIFIEMFGDPASNLKEWSCLPLSQLMDENGLQNGLYKPSTDYGSGTPILRIDAFYDGKVTKLDSLKRVRLSDVELKLYSLRADDVVINRVNSIEYLGKSALIPKLLEPTVFESNMMRFSVSRNIVEPAYVVQFLQTKFIKNQILSCSKNAVNQSSINQQDVKGFQINVPPLHLQQEFISRINAVEALRLTYRTAIAELDALFASLQHRAFQGNL
jgi:type I restriction enzyme S subunit